MTNMKDTIRNALVSKLQSSSLDSITVTDIATDCGMWSTYDLHKRCLQKFYLPWCQIFLVAINNRRCPVICPAFHSLQIIK